MPAANNILVCLNRRSGGVERGPKDVEAIRRALRDAGIHSRIEVLEGGRISARAEAAAKRGDRMLIVAGGDGTVSAAASKLAGTRTTLGILPLGTRNHFARDLRLQTDVAAAASVIGSGRRMKVDVAEMNGRIFVNNSTIGFYPLMVLDRDSQRDRLGRSKRLAMVVASARTLARFDHQRLTLTINDQQARVDTPLLFVGNNDYRLEIPGAGRRESIADGKLCVLVMRKKTRRGFLAATVRTLLGRTRTDDMVRIDDVRRLRVESRRSDLDISLDGEVLRVPPPLDYRIRKHALTVIVP